MERAVLSESSMEGDGNETIEEGINIRQGFLCPFCLEDLGDASHLFAHVDKYHPASTSSANGFDHLKGLFGKAKQKIMQMDKPFSSLDLPTLGTGPSVVISDVRRSENELLRRRISPQRIDSVQEMGVCRSHKEYFLKCRAPCINDAAMRTNNLIIRLDKLINQCPADVNQRKEFERNTVPWVADKESNACRVCNERFTITRRRHHCRLCGKMMCHACSQFLSFITARKLTNPAFAAQMLEEMSRAELESSIVNQSKPNYASLSSSKSSSTSMTDAIRNAVSGDSLMSVRKKSEKIFSSTLAIMKGDGSEVSLSSLLQQLQDEDQHLRICAVCKGLLSARDEKMEQMSVSPMVVVLYDRLCSLIREAEKLTSSYARMHDSLNKGESMYTLESATQLRKKVVYLQREIDSVSAKIETLGTSEDSSQKISPRERVLQKNIRLLAISTLQWIISQLRALPSEDEYKRLQENRRAEIKRQTELQAERNAFIVNPCSSNTSLKDLTHAAPEDENVREVRSKDYSDSFTIIEPASAFGDDGWTPCTQPLHAYNPFVDDEPKINPLQEQIYNIKRFLKQAAEDGRLNEVEILEKNLCDLENELRLRTTDNDQ
ncbi:unnamed protein product [Anisakis simplex]|uniref:FYVE-type domain-containing protein n=1 Tax=Anisakis simplex TaxID=6269 RepID=A0A3P6Q3K6_ANISI|nr:unnamed protein product [Anisakis simplex]